MLFVLGIGTLVAQANTLVAILCDHYKWMKASSVALITTICGFLSGIIYVTPVLMCAKKIAAHFIFIYKAWYSVQIYREGSQAFIISLGIF